MLNMLDYVKLRMEVPFSAEPFNVVDAMVLARISYLPLAKLRIKNGLVVSEIAKQLARIPEVSFAWPDDKKLAELLADSRRFGECRVENFVRENNMRQEKQFTAITIWIKPRLAYISFLGTDSSLFGWKEDFNMVFMDEVPAQTEAVKYFKRFVRRHPFSRVYLGGHSKGGNLAMYSAITTSDFMQAHIEKVYNFDGPGLRKKLADRDAGRPVIQKIESFIPQDSLIGRLLEHREKYTVVKSHAKSLYQHDIYSWEVDGTGLVESKSTERSDFNDRMITHWLEAASEEERKVFIDACFQIMKESEVGNPVALVTSGIRKVPAIFAAFLKLDESQRAMLIKMLIKLAEAYYKTARKK